jgi:hypothetical protein
MLTAHDTTVAVAVLIALLTCLYEDLYQRDKYVGVLCSCVKLFIRTVLVGAISIYLLENGAPITHFPYSEIFEQHNSHWYAIMLESLSLIECIVWVPMVINIISFFFYPPLPWSLFCKPEELQDLRQTDEKVCIRFVTRGDNPRALAHAVRRCQIAIDGRKHTCVDVDIEVVTDTLVPDLQVSQIVVPSKKDYQTAKGTLYKARALLYANEASNLGDNDWILHMDEESTIDECSLDVVLGWLLAPDRKTTDIAQGLISYNNVAAFEGFQHYICTVADSVRVADDLFRFQLQYDLFGSAPFGVHGSFLFLNNGFERKVGLDLGPELSVTEDSAFAFKTLAQGSTFHYLQAEVYEQSPTTFADLCHQRARWMRGLWFIVLFERDNCIRSRNRILLCFMLVPLTLAPLYFAFTFLFAIVKGFDPNVLYPSTQALHQIMACCWITLYVCGFVRAQWFSKFSFGKALLT